MSWAGDVAAAGPDGPIEEAARQVARRPIRPLPVVVGGIAGYEETRDGAGRCHESVTRRSQNARR
jgi:hypothetical protein